MHAYHGFNTVQSTTVHGFLLFLVAHLDTGLQSKQMTFLDTVFNNVITTTNTLLQFFQVLIKREMRILSSALFFVVNHNEDHNMFGQCMRVSFCNPLNAKSSHIPEKESSRWDNDRCANLLASMQTMGYT